MPVAQIDLTGDNIRTRVEAFLGAELGVLVSVCAFITSTTSPQPTNRVEIGVCDAGPLPTSRIAILAAGYLQQNSSVAWTGAYPLDKSLRVYIMLQSSDSATIRLAITTSKD